MDETLTAILLKRIMALPPLAHLSPFRREIFLSVLFAELARSHLFDGLTVDDLTTEKGREVARMLMADPQVRDRIRRALLPLHCAQCRTNLDQPKDPIVYFLDTPNEDGSTDVFCHRCGQNMTSFKGHALVAINVRTGRRMVH